MNPLKGAWDYLTHRFDPRNYRVIMTILVKNEEDIIEENIRVHAALGVDGFAVMDHMSSDGTREKLEALKSEFDLQVIDQKDPIYKQSEWMTQLAETARDEMGADWVISNDADEFWLPSGEKNLKEHLAFKGSIVTCHRYNMLLDYRALEPDYKFYDGLLRVENPIFFPNDQLKKDNATIVLSKIAPKVIVNPHGLLKVKGGNHRAKHAANVTDYMKHYDKLKRHPEIKVYHYAIRSYAHFEANIAHRKWMLQNEPGCRMGNHYRRWIQLLDEGTLRGEYEKFLFSEEEAAVMKKFGVIVEDPFPGEKIRTLLGR